VHIEDDLKGNAQFTMYRALHLSSKDLIKSKDASNITMLTLTVK
jgi:hypothetical protein